MKRKVYFILPSYRKMDGSIVKGWTLFNSSINLPLLSAATPKNWEKEMCNEYFSEVNYNNDAPVVVITTVRYDILHGLEMAKRFKELGKIVIFGLHLDSFSDSLFKRVCDAVFYGVPNSEAMSIILEDAINNNLKDEYQVGVHINFDFDYSVFNDLKFRHLPITTSVGCINSCDYCCLNATYSGRYYLRPIRHVIADMISIKKQSGIAAFKDPNFYNNRKYVHALCKEIIKQRIKLRWGAHSTINIGEDEETLRLLYKAGCRMLLIGYETLSQKNLDAIKKPFRASDYMKNTKAIRKSGIFVVGYFMIGFDDDSVETFDEVYTFIRALKMRLPLINILTPIPGTNTFKKLLEEGRMKIRTADEFIMQKPIYSVPNNYCLFTPKNMTEKELETGYTDLYRKLTRYNEIFHRAFSWNPLDFLLLLKFNLDLRKEYGKLSSAHHLDADKL